MGSFYIPVRVETKPKTSDLVSNPDIVFVGGGLSAVLHAVALFQRAPETRALVLEQGEALGGNHRWSFFDTDLDDAGRALLQGLPRNHWIRNEVRFPAHARMLETGYNSLTSADFDSWARTILPPEWLRFGVKALEVSPDTVRLANGEVIEAGMVIDARGPHSTDGMEVGWQKFAGYEVQMPGHGLDHPIIMDATVEQLDGYRFVYALPLDRERLFIEDTYYSDGPDLNEAELRARTLDYAAQLAPVQQVLSSETGCLPIVISGDPDRVWPPADTVARIGMHGGMFHHTTGYSLPFAVDSALQFADAWIAGTARDAEWFRQRFVANWQRQGYYRLLNTMLFRAATPERRYCTFEHFYRVPQALIERFYSARLTFADKARVLIGKPPVPVGAAVKALLGGKA